MHWLFETERLSVRPKAAADAESFHAVYTDDDVMRFCGGSFTTLERTRDFVASHMRHQDVHGFSMWALVHRGTRTVLGDVGFLGYEDGVEIGWHLRRSAWGRGYATEAARACLAYGFEQLKFTRVSASRSRQTRLRSASSRSSACASLVAGQTVFRPGRNTSSPPPCPTRRPRRRSSRRVALASVQ